MIRYLFLLGFLFSSLQLTAKPLALSIRAQSAILINAETGAILYEKDAYRKQYPASTTKIATALYVLKEMKQPLDLKISASQDAIGTMTEEALKKSNYKIPYRNIPDGSHIGIKKGEELSFKDLFFGMLVASGNDASNVLAEYTSGNILQFMTNLNRYLDTIGCKNTTFYNPHGLFHPNHQTTAYDLALIMKEALKHPLFYEAISSTRFSRPKTNKQEATTYLQTNRLIRKGKYYYPKAIGGKTGYFSKAGKNLVVAAKDDQRTLVAVLLNNKERDEMFADAIKMFDAAFNQPKVQKTVLKKGPQKYTLDIPGASKNLKTYLEEDVTFEYYPAEESKIRCMLHWTNLKLPVSKNQKVGELHLESMEGKKIKIISLLSQEEIQPTWWWSATHFFN